VRTETVPPEGSPTVVDYLVDTSGPLSQVVAESTVVGGGAAGLSAYYVRGDDLLAVMRPGEGGGWVSRYYHADGLGSIRALTDEAGAVTDRWTFTAFGELLAHVGEDPNAHLFAGEMLDPNSGFYYNRARWMDPGVGRFLSMDRFAGFEHEPGTLHKYIYVRNHPLDSLDPSGLFEFSVSSLLVSAAISGIINAIIAYASGETWSGIAVKYLVGAVEGELFSLGVGLVAWAVRIAWRAAAAAKVAITAFRFRGVIPLVGFKSPIASYRALQAVTKGHAGAIQAHHILEARHLRYWGYADDAIANVPAQVLTHAEHVQISNALRQALPYGTRYTRDQVWAAYQMVYRQYPQYLRAIQHYFI
jgi:RHS repeat-associated protein